MNVDRPAASVLVLGGAGFIGRHVVSALAGMSCRIVVGSRYPSRIESRLPSEIRGSECRHVRFERMLKEEDWRGPLDSIDAVVNCVGILRQRGRETYDRVHRGAPAALAVACRDRGIRLVHVSALGLDAPSSSRFLRSKLDGEHAIRRSGADWLIVRPSLLDGDGGYGASWLRRVAHWPVHPVPATATGRIAVLDVRDLGEVLARLTLMSTDERKVLTSDRAIELGGTETRTLAEHLSALRSRASHGLAWRLTIPGLVARLGSHLCDLVHATPFSFGHLKLLGRDNCPKRNSLEAILGRAPRVVGNSRRPAASNVPALTPETRTG